MKEKTDAMLETVTKTCAHLERTARDLGVVLSLTNDCIPDLEEILLSLKELNNEGALNGGVFMAGVYLGEILRQSLNGQWTFNEQYQQLALSVHANLFFPIAKAHKFVQNPQGDGLVFFAQSVISECRSPSKKMS